MKLISKVLAQTAEEAQEIIQESRGLIPSCENGCGWNEFLALLQNIADLLIKIVPFVAMFWIIYGGFEILIAGGDAGRLNKGKEKIKNAIIGLVLVYGSILIYNIIKGVFSG